MLKEFRRNISDALKLIGIVLPSALDVIEYSEVDQSVSPEERKRLKDALTLISDSPEASSDTVRLADALQLHMPEGVQERLRNDMALYGESMVLTRGQEGGLFLPPEQMDIAASSGEFMGTIMRDNQPNANGDMFNGEVGWLFGQPVYVTSALRPGDFIVTNTLRPMPADVGTVEPVRLEHNGGPDWSVWEEMGISVSNHGLQVMAGPIMESLGWDKIGEHSRKTKAWEERWR